MFQQFLRQNIDVRVFDAIEIEGSVESSPGYDAEARQRYYGWPLSRGEVGCYMSHRAVWQHLLDSADDAWCVMEDDILIFDGFQSAVERIHAHRNEWDVVRLTHLNNHHRHAYATLSDSLKLLWMARPANGTMGYLVTRQGAKRLLEHSSRMFHAIDVVLDRQWEHRLRIFVTSPTLVEHAGFASTINTTPPPKRPLLLRLRAKFWRRLGKCRAAVYNVRYRAVLFGRSMALKEK